jgi:hypothetical protein
VTIDRSSARGHSFRQHANDRRYIQRDLRADPADSLRATYRRGDPVAQATLSRVALTELMLPGANVAWTTKTSEFLNTTLQEGGKPIRLEVVIKKPSGRGPFPLLVFNHGSTGRGTDPRLFTATQVSQEIADLFVGERLDSCVSPAPRQRQIGWSLRRGFRAVVPSVAIE